MRLLGVGIYFTNMKESPFTLTHILKCPTGQIQTECCIRGLNSLVQCLLLWLRNETSQFAVNRLFDGGTKPETAGLMG